MELFYHKRRKRDDSGNGWTFNLWTTLASKEHMGTSETCMGTSETCMGTSETHMGTSETCMGTSETHMGTSETCMGTSETHMGTSETFVFCLNLLKNFVLICYSFCVDKIK
jgi:hypothetical protein